jgi:molybdenum-pterin binding domain
MEISARNVFNGKVKKLVTGIVSTEVTLEIAPDLEITAIISKASAERLGMAEGKSAYALFKASDVLIGVD